MIGGRPPLKDSNSVDKPALPGCMQVLRGIDVRGNYVGDVTGLEDEQIEIPGAAAVERLLLPFWDNGQHSPIPSIEQHKTFISDQTKRFPELRNYPCRFSEPLTKLPDGFTPQMRAGSPGCESVLNAPEAP